MMMPGGGPFTAEHVSALAARAAELENIGEEAQNPHAFMRAARLYKLAVRIADEVDEPESAHFTHRDLDRLRDELRRLATDTAVAGMLGDHGIPSRTDADASGNITRLFREIALRIEQRLAGTEARPRPRLDTERRT
jgi:hypothetical protein